MDWSIFQKTTLESWNLKLSKELKDIAPESLKKELEESLSIEFLYTQSEVKKPLKTLGNWKIRQDFNSSEFNLMKLAFENGSDLVGVKSDIKPQMEGNFLLESNSQIQGCQTVWYPSYQNLTQGTWNPMFINSDFYGINAGIYQEAGGNAIHALTFLIKEAIENQHNNYLVNLSVGRNYFLEIAKFRALRILWKQHLNEKNVEIHAKTGSWNKTIQDVHSNLIRNTLEAMSAILGTADVVCVSPFDERENKNSEFTSRMARNIQLMLKEESYMGKVADPIAGSHYVENLTQSIVSEVNKILSSYQNISFQSMIIDNTIQNIIADNLSKRKQNVEEKKSIFVGVNKFVNPMEKSTYLEKKEEIIQKTDFKTLKINYITN